MTAALRRPSIKAIPVGDQTRYRWVVDVGIHPATGKRRQLTRTFDNPEVAERELARTLDSVRDGSVVLPSKLTVGEFLDEWLHGQDVASYREALKPVRDWYGGTPLQRLSEGDVEKLIAWMMASGRRRGGKPGTALSRRTVHVTLLKLRAVLDSAVKQHLIGRNVAAMVELPDDREPVVYFAERHGFVKIGHSRQPEIRLDQIGKGSCMPSGMCIGPVRLVATMPGALADEKATHARFDHLRFEGEWFLLDDELWGYITALPGYTGESRLAVSHA